MRNRVTDRLVKLLAMGLDRRHDTERRIAPDRGRARGERLTARWRDVSALSNHDIPSFSKDWPYRWP